MIYDINDYWGKSPDTIQTVPHLLKYHCLDVAALSQVLLNNDKESFNRHTMFPHFYEKIPPSFYSFCIAMHDLGKFSDGFQNNIRTHRPFPLGHADLGFYLLKKIWDRILSEDWLCMGQVIDKCDSLYVLTPWFQTVTMYHHRGVPKNLDVTQVNVNLHFTKDNEAHADLFVLETLNLLADKEFKMFLQKLKKNHYDAFKNHIPDLLEFMRFCDTYCSKHFPPCSTTMDIEEYWNKNAIKQAEYEYKKQNEEMRLYFPIRQATI